MRRMVSDKDIALLEDLESNNINSNTISQVYIVDNIKAISGDILTKLKAGDIVLKNTNGQLHAYNVSFKKDGTGICLTYTDASVVETQSYDYTNGAWVYNSEDKTNLVNYSAGDNVNITNGVISATDTTYTAGTNITISDGVISAAAGDVWQSRLRINTGYGNVDVEIYTKEEITNDNKYNILIQEISNSKFKQLFISQYGLPVINDAISMPITLFNTAGNNIMHYYELSDPSTIKSTIITLNSSVITIEWSHKIV